MIAIFEKGPVAVEDDACARAHVCACVCVRPVTCQYIFLVADIRSPGLEFLGHEGTLRCLWLSVQIA